MEPTANFAAGLAEARRQLAEEGKLTNDDRELTDKLLNNPVMVRADGTRVRVLYRVHVRVRTLYAKLNRSIVIGSLDWMALVQWLKDHWVEVIRTILQVLLVLI